MIQLTRGPNGDAKVGSLFVDSRVVTVDEPVERVFERIRRVGGDTGWYYADWLWRRRGIIDSLLGGIGLRRGRRDPEDLVVGDVVDCWRVEAYEPNRLLRLALEMKIPGRGWLEFEVNGNGSASTVRQTATYMPVGLLGRVHWYLFYPLHRLIFAGMLQGIARKSGRKVAPPEDL